jgi:hypothetical protein
MEMQHLPNKFIFMKVGNHAGETFEQILARKKAEHKKAGMIFWGYGGFTCHPLTHVQPFIRDYYKSGPLYLLMQTIESKANPEVLPAAEYSVDGINWFPIPDGITVTGSRFALVLDEIQPGDLDFPLNRYRVAVGNSEGKRADQYLRGHVDKGCFVREEDHPRTKSAQDEIRKISYMATLKPPYAVFLKGPKP